MMSGHSHRCHSDDDHYPISRISLSARYIDSGLVSKNFQYSYRKANPLPAFTRHSSCLAFFLSIFFPPFPTLAGFLSSLSPGARSEESERSKTEEKAVLVEFREKVRQRGREGAGDRAEGRGRQVRDTWRS